MEPIKFRAWHKKEQRFYYFDIETVTQIYYRGYYHPVTGEKDCELDDPTLYSEKQLYTGLLDKCGKEIYEGDIVVFDKDNPQVKPKVALPVVYENGGFFVGIHDRLFLSHVRNAVEVIGNIYENGSLLDGE